MRYIDHKHLRRFADLRELEEANQNIATLPADQLSDYIDNNATKCSSLRLALWTVGCAKCWYSESSLQEGEGHVEHYRPKKRLSGTHHNGYWWKAFDW